MKIRRYIGKDTQDAMLKVRLDLGSDAIILNTRKIRQKGFLKFFSKPLVEVLAAVDEGATQSNLSEPGNGRNKSAAGVKNSITDKKGILKEPVEERYDSDIGELEQKVKNMEQLLDRIYKQMQPANNSSIQSSMQLENPMDKTSKIIQVFSNNLIHNNVDISIVNEIASEVKSSVSQSASVNDIAAKMYNRIITLLDKPQPIQLNNDAKAKIIVFVGPTGVGKTTTLAKIAAIFSINYKKNIGYLMSKNKAEV